MSVGTIEPGATDQPVVRHRDFEKIRAAFVGRYGKAEGEKQYNAWLGKLGLDQSKPYGDSQKTEGLQESFVSEKFSVVLVTESLADKHPWVKPHLEEIKVDKDAKWYLVNALFPWTSMNGNTYTDEELGDATRSIIDKPNDLNHTDEVLAISSRDAQYFKKSCEVLARVPKDASCSVGNLCQLIDNADKEENGIVHVSVEAKCLRGVGKPTDMGVNTDGSNVCQGLCFTGLGWLTKKTLPGVPLTKIQPLEKLLECLACPCSCQGSKINYKGVENTSKIELKDEFENPINNEGASSDDHAARKARSGTHGIAAKDQGHVTKPGKFKDIPDDQFADPVNYKYPIDNDHVMAAWRYINKPENQAKGGYSDAEWSKMKDRVAAAMKKYGHDVAGEEKLTAKFCPSCGKPLMDSECTNKECELCGKKIGLAGDDSGSSGSDGDGDEKRRESVAVEAKTPCEKARESLLKRVRELEDKFTKSPKEMTAAELDFIKQVHGDLKGQVDALSKQLNDHIAAAQQGAGLPQNDAPPVVAPGKPDDPKKTNLPPVPSTDIPTQSPAERSQPQDAVPAVTVPKAENPDPDAIPFKAPSVEFSTVAPAIASKSSSAAFPPEERKQSGKSEEKQLTPLDLSSPEALKKSFEKRLDDYRDPKGAWRLSRQEACRAVSMDLLQAHVDWVKQHPKEVPKA